MPSQYSYGLVTPNQQDPSGLISGGISHRPSPASSSSVTRSSSPARERQRGRGREKIVIDENGSRVVVREEGRARSIGPKNKARIIIQEENPPAEPNGQVNTGEIGVQSMQKTKPLESGQSSTARETRQSETRVPGSVARARAGLLLYEQQQSSESPAKVERRHYVVGASKHHSSTTKRSGRLVLRNSSADISTQASDNAPQVEPSRPPDSPPKSLSSHLPGDVRSLRSPSIGSRSSSSTWTQQRLPFVKSTSTPAVLDGSSSSIPQRQTSIDSRHSSASGSVSNSSVASSHTGAAPSVVSEIYNPILEAQTSHPSHDRVKSERSQSLTSTLMPRSLEPRSRPVSIVRDSDRQRSPVSAGTRQSSRRSECTLRGSRPNTAQTPRPIVRTGERRWEDDEGYYGGSEEDVESPTSLSSLSSFSLVLKPSINPDQIPDLPSDFHYITQFPPSRSTSSGATSPSLIRGYSTDDAVPPPISRYRPSNPALRAQVPGPQASPSLLVQTVPLAHPYLPPQVHPPRGSATTSRRVSTSNHRLPFHMPSLNIFHHKHSKDSSSQQQPRPITNVAYTTTPPLHSRPPSIPYTSPFRPSPEPTLEEPPPRSNSWTGYT